MIHYGSSGDGLIPLPAMENTIEQEMLEAELKLATPEIKRKLEHLCKNLHNDVLTTEVKRKLLQGLLTDQELSPYPKQYDD